MAAGLLFANSSAEVKNPAYYKHRKGKMVLHAQKYQANIRDHYSTGIFMANITGCDVPEYNEYQQERPHLYWKDIAIVIVY